MQLVVQLSTSAVYTSILTYFWVYLHTSCISGFVLTYVKKYLVGVLPRFSLDPLWTNWKKIYIPSQVKPAATQPPLPIFSFPGNIASHTYLHSFTLTHTPFLSPPFRNTPVAQAASHTTYIQPASAPAVVSTHPSCCCCLSTLGPLQPRPAACRSSSKPHATTAAIRLVLGCLHCMHHRLCPP